MLAVLLAGAGRRSGKFRNNVEQPHASNARLPLCLSVVLPRNTHRAGRRGPCGQRVSWGRLQPSAAPQPAAQPGGPQPHTGHRLGGHVVYVAWQGRGSVEVRLENWVSGHQKDLGAWACRRATSC